MAKPDKEALQSALDAVAEPWLGGTLGEAGWPVEWDIDEKRVGVTIVPGYPLRRSRTAFAEKIREALRPVAGGGAIKVQFKPAIKAHPVQPNMARLAHIKNVIAVASAKGGGGRSTGAVNMALARADEGARVGMLDADIYGPSQPRMLGLAGRPQVSEGKKIVPMAGFGLKVM